MLTRQRTELGLSESHMMACPCCLGYGSVQSFDTLTLSIFKALERAGLKKDITGKSIQLILHPVAGDYLSNQKRHMLVEIEKLFKTSVHIIYDSALDLSQYKIEIKTPEHHETQTIQWPKKVQVAKN
jgi:Ribonuclease G/E